MENSNNIQNQEYFNCKVYGQVQANSVQVDKLLSPEMMQLILSYLNFKDYESTVLVNHYWKDLTVQTAAYRISRELKVFLTFLSQNLKEEPGISQIEISYSECNSSQNLIQIKSFLEKPKKEIAEVLKELKEIDLKRLKETHVDAKKPEFFEDIFYLTGIYKELNEAMAESDENKKIPKYIRVATKFVGVGDFEKPFEIVDMIKYDFGRNHALLAIAEKLAKKGKYERALKIVDDLVNEKDKRSALCDICMGLAEFGNFEKSLEILKTIEQCDEKNGARVAISHELIKIGNTKKALEITNEISH